MVVGSHNDLVHRGVADATFREVDDAAKGSLILLVDGEPEVSKEVLDFLALIERKTTYNLILDVHPPKGFFNGPALAVGSVENDEVAELQLMLHLLFEDGCGNQLPFFVVGDSFDELDQVAFFVSRPNILGELSLVLGDDRIGSLHNGLRRPVILFEFDNFQIGMIFFKIEDVADVCTTECIDALGIITYNGNILPDSRKFSNDKVLTQFVSWNSSTKMY